MLMLLTVGIL